MAIPPRLPDDPIHDPYRRPELEPPEYEPPLVYGDDDESSPRMGLLIGAVLFVLVFGGAFVWWFK